MHIQHLKQILLSEHFCRHRIIDIYAQMGFRMDHVLCSPDFLKKNLL